MKRVILVVTLLLTVMILHAAKICKLENVMKPTALIIAGDSILIAGQKTVQQYSLKGKQFIRFIGEIGQGPSEFIQNPKIYFQTPDKILVQSYTKLSIFATDGIFINDIRFPTRISKIVPFGKRYVGSVLKFHGGEEKWEYITTLFDKKFNPIKDIASHKSQNPLKRIDVIYFDKSFVAYKNRLYISKPKKGGLMFDVYNKEGEKIYSIHKYFERIRVSKEFISKKILEIKSLKKEYWHLIKDKLHFPKYYPPIQAFNICDDKIFIKTWISRDNKTKFTIMDMKGKVLNNIFLPEAGRLYDINDSHYYYLNENIDDEVWEIHWIAIK